MSEYPSTIEIFGKKATGTDKHSDYIRWAMGLMLAGEESPHLAELASLPENSHAIDREEIRRCFKHSLEELGIEPVDEALALKDYCLCIARGMLDEKIDLYESVLFFCQLASNLNYPRALVGWVLLADMLDNNYNYVAKEFYPYATLYFGDKNFATVAKEKALEFIEELNKADSLEPKKKRI